MGGKESDVPTHTDASSAEGSNPFAVQAARALLPAFIAVMSELADDTLLVRSVSVLARASSFPVVNATLSVVLPAASATLASSASTRSVTVLADTDWSFFCCGGRGCGGVWSIA